VSDQYDVLVIGAGAAGENAADVAARDGLRVAIIERELVGGLCSYWGCIPSKALLRPGDILAEAKRVPGAAQAIGDLDVEAVFKRRDALSYRWDDQAQVDWVDSVGVDLIRGHARLAGPRVVEVDLPDGETVRYEATKAVVVATGTSASIPPIPGIEEVGVWDNRDITTASEVPSRLLVIGGGPIGVEMAQAWKWLGCEEVTVVELSDRLLPHEEPFAGEELAASLERMSIDVLVGAETTQLTRDDEGIHATIELPDGSTTEVVADELLAATGRDPNTTDIGIETVGLEPGEFIEVDDHMVATGVEGDWLYAVGDVNGRALLTHTGKYQARIAGAHINGVDTKAWGDVKAIPRVVFTSPQVAAVGLTEAQAQEEGINVQTVRYDIGRVAAASLLGRGYKGTCQLVIDAERRTIVRATFVGPHAGELLHAATIAIAGEVTLDTLWHAIPSFPTLSEIWLRLLETYRDERRVRLT
jgi:pyruvate/2-oxoglutarate dehydrogenase complex dihydrolipoamide dehydrogenase (E3) component